MPRQGLEILGPLFLRPRSIRFGGELGGAGRAIISTSSTCQKREEEEESSLTHSGWREGRVQFPNE